MDACIFHSEQYQLIVSVQLSINYNECIHTGGLLISAFINSFLMVQIGPKNIGFTLCIRA